MKRNILYLIGVVCMMTSCLNGGFDTSAPSKDGDINFTASLNKVQTRTLYDAEQIAESFGAVKVNWVHNDLITVYGRQCTAVKQAEYSVGSVKVDGNNNPVLDANGNEQPVSGQSYANYLRKTGAAGVQWGAVARSDFYAVYPSTDSDFEISSKGAKVKTSIRTVQNNVFKYDESRKCWVGTPYIQNPNQPTMVDALMFACTKDVKASDNFVDLNFTPWSTVLKFRFEGFKYTNVGVQQKTVSVKRIVLQAPTDADIAGDLELEINRSNNTATATPLGPIDNTITITPDYLPLSTEQAVEFCVFTIPQSGLEFGTDPSKLWKVTIETSDGTSFTYKMRPSSGNAKLAAGKIHRVNIPQKEIDRVGDLTDSKDNWMEQIPRNVYLSELSVPGSWYCTDSNYSGTDDLTALYNGGVRAFHIDCRLTKGSRDDDYKLMCAGTESASGNRVTGKDVLSQLTRLNALVNQKPEYIVVVLTIAEKTKDGSNLSGTVDPAQVLPAIADMLNSTDNAAALSNLYTGGISSKTIVKDVLGKMIVLVNSNTNNYTRWYNAPSLIAEASLAPSSSGNIVGADFTQMQTRDIYWGTQKTDLHYHYHHAQRTTTDANNVSGVPKYRERKAAIDDIIERSDDIYLNSTHNGWFMMGIGGYRKNSGLFQTESHTEVATQMNPYLLNWIELKLEKKEGYYPSPVGIVLMNYPLDRTYSGPQLIEAIMNMNAAFPLIADPSRDEETGEVLPDNIAGWAEVTSWDDVQIN